MDAKIRGSRLPLVGIRGVMFDSHSDDEPGVPAVVGFQVSQEAVDKLAIFFLNEDLDTCVQIDFSMLDGVLSADIIDYAKLGPRDIPCGADAVASASIRIHPRRKKR
jgi:hypothetical protein